MIAGSVSAEEHFATKAEAGLGELRAVLRQMVTKADLVKLEARLTRWFVGLLGAMVGLFIAVIINVVFTVLLLG
ncbi:MAG: hypothetical protein OXU67_13695 [Chloroflexota bacterium]|nr:hypothetical protein [Chloroflexota bacterium]